jgi:predicted PurR-regulated permease PerM
VGFGIVLFSTSAKVASIVLESIPKLMFSIFFSFLITIFILVSIPQIYNAMKAAFGTKEQSKSLQNSVNNLSNEVKDLRERYERHIAEQYHMNIKDVKKDKKYSQT